MLATTNVSSLLSRPRSRAGSFGHPLGRYGASAERAGPGEGGQGIFCGRYKRSDFCGEILAMQVSDPEQVGDVLQ